MKVLIVKASALGDVVHALPVLAWLKSADPGLEIDWLVEEGFAPLLDGHPLLRQVLRLQTKAWRKAGGLAAVRGGWGLVRRLRSQRYDVVLDLQGNSKSGLFTWLSGAPRRYGFCRDGVREWPNLLSTNRKVPLGENDFHITDRSLAIARTAFPAGNRLVAAGPMHEVCEAAEKVERLLQEAGYGDGVPRVVLHYGTTWSTKLWPLESWRALALRLVEERGIRPLLTWGNAAEREAASAIRQACAGRAVIWPRGTLPELVALLGRADLVVGADTGPIHIAAALDTPTVSLFRVTDASRNGPRGLRHVSIQAPMDCSPCLRKSCDLDAACGRSIEVSDVYDSISRLLDDARAVHGAKGRVE